MPLRRWAMVCCVVMTLIWPGAVAYAATPTVVPDPSVVTVAVGQTADINIRLQDVSDVYGIDVRLRFDPFTMEIVDADQSKDGVQVQAGGFPQPDFTVRNVVDNAMGTADYAVVQLNPTLPASGSGTIFSVKVRGKVAGRQSTLSVDAVTVADRSGNTIAVQRLDGTVIVVSAGDSGQPTPPVSVLPTPTTTATAAPTATLPQPGPTGTNTPAATAPATPTATPASGTPAGATPAAAATATPPPALPIATLTGGVPASTFTARPATPSAQVTRQSSATATTAPVAARSSVTPRSAPTLPPAAVQATASATAEPGGGPLLAAAGADAPTRTAAGRAPMPLGPAPAANASRVPLDLVVAAMMIMGGVVLLGLLWQRARRRP